MGNRTGTQRIVDMPHLNTTKRALLEAAEELWGQHGLNGISLRKIIEAAESSNTAAIRYHFKNKEGLVKAVLLWRLERMEAARGAHLAALVSTGQSLGPEHFLEALLRPVADVRGRSGKHNYAAFLSALYDAGQFSLRHELGRSGPTSGQLAQMIVDQQPIRDESKCRRRMMQASYLYWHGLVLYDRDVAGTRPAGETEAEFLADLMCMAKAVLMAA